MILQTLYQQCLKNDVTFFDEFHVVDLIFSEGRCAGVVAYRIRTGELHVFHAKGPSSSPRAGQVGCSNHLQRPRAHGRRHGIAYRRGLPLEDMEFSIPPHGHLQDGHPALGGVPGRGRKIAERPGRAVHGALRSPPCWIWPARL